MALDQWHAHLDSKGFILIHGLKEGGNKDSRNELEASQSRGCSTHNETTIGEVSKA
ncbi:hypothetical protein D3C79_1030250 [compost metagenome]